MAHITPLRPDERAAATAMCVRAFARDPLMHHLFDDASVPFEHGVAALMELAFETRSSRGWPVLAARGKRDEPVGVAYLSLPLTGPSLAGAASLEEPPRLTEVRERFERDIGPAALARYRDYEAAWTVGAPEMPHHYLGVLAVDPAAQKSGLGVALLREVFAIVDADDASQGLWLDTENPPNVGFYERQGFRVAAERPLGNVSIWGMWRESKRVRG